MTGGQTKKNTALKNTEDTTNFDNSLPKPPSPADFPAFFPYLCQKLGLGDVYVVKLTQETYIQSSIKKKGIKANAKNVVLEKDENVFEKGSKAFTFKPIGAGQRADIDAEYAVVINAYHTARNHLVEISIEQCKALKIKHIKALIFCLPFQKLLTKVNILQCSLDQGVLQQIWDLVCDSSITDLLLDDTWCKHGNCYVPLRNTTNLKRLSMNRCRINDDDIEELFGKIEFNFKDLQILELSSNLITDKGALIIGNTLRTNRVLIHINLAGNKITDTGLAYIFNSLMEFELTDDEIEEKLKRYGNFLMLRWNVYQGCLAEELRQQHSSTVQMAGKGTEQAKPRNRVVNLKQQRTPTATTTFKQNAKQKKMEYDVNMIAAMKSLEIIGGPFTDVFDDGHVRREDGKIFCIGNFKLASINLAYNKLTHLGMRTIQKTLECQLSKMKNVGINACNKGLVRIIVDGNNLCKRCMILDDICSMLESKIQAKAVLRPKYLLRKA